MNIELDDYSQTEAFEETELQESSKIETFEVTLDLDGERLDKVLASSLKDISRSRLKTLIEDGLVKVNGKTVDKPKEKMSFGDEVSVEIKPRLEDMDFIATPMDIDVVYEDDDILVINKPARLVVHPAAGHWDDTLLNGLLAYSCKMDGAQLKETVRNFTEGYPGGFLTFNRGSLPVFSGISVEIRETEDGLSLIHISEPTRRS